MRYTSRCKLTLPSPHILSHRASSYPDCAAPAGAWQWGAHRHGRPWSRRRVIKELVPGNELPMARALPAHYPRNYRSQHYSLTSSEPGPDRKRPQPSFICSRAMMCSYTSCHRGRSMQPLQPKRVRVSVPSSTASVRIHAFRQDLVQARRCRVDDGTVMRAASRESGRARGPVRKVVILLVQPLRQAMAPFDNDGGSSSSGVNGRAILQRFKGQSQRLKQPP
jgi:hypothetical protein